MYAKDTLGTKTIVQRDLNASPERLKNRSNASEDVNLYRNDWSLYLKMNLLLRRHDDIRGI